MGPDLELRSKSEASMDISTGKDDKNIPQDTNAKLMHCLSNYEDHDFHMQAMLEGKKTDIDENVEVDIIDSKNSYDPSMVRANYEDLTESLSSFGETLSDMVNGSTLSDAEVESEYHGIEGPFLNGSNGAFSMRKKKLTDHWRRFIHPIKWRCKWLETQMMLLHSLISKYDIELEEYEKNKMVNFENLTSSGLDSKSIAFSTNLLREEIMKRRKRKRVEETVDMASYMSHHNLFSFYDKKSVVDSGSMKDTCGYQGSDNALDFGDGDSSIGQILLKIEMMQSRVCKLRSRIEKVISENPGKFSSVKKLAMPTQSDSLTCSGQNQSSSHENGLISPIQSLYAASQHLSDCNTQDLLLPEPTLGRTATISGIVETTNQNHVGVGCNDVEEAVLINNQAAEVELLNFEQVHDQLVEKPQEVVEECTVHPAFDLEAGLANETLSAGEGSHAKSLSTAKPNNRNTKRRRGKRASSMRKLSKKARFS